MFLVRRVSKFVSSGQVSGKWRHIYKYVVAEIVNNHRLFPTVCLYLTLDQHTYLLLADLLAEKATAEALN